jgi:hypothetical protein
MELKDILVLILAVYGAVLSTVNLILQLRSKRWRITASYSLGYDGKNNVITFQAINFGERNVALRDVSIGLVRRRSWFHARRGISMFSDSYLTAPDPFPIDLSPGKSVEVTLNQKVVLDGLISSGFGSETKAIVGIFRDETKKEYVTPRIKVDLKNRTIRF